MSELNKKTGLMLVFCILTSCDTPEFEEPPISALEDLAPGVEPVSGNTSNGTGGLILPDGFSATVVYEGTGESRELLILENGDMFVSRSGLREGPHIFGLRDTDGDYVVDRVEPFFEVATPAEQKVPRVHIEYHEGYLYAVTNEQASSRRIQHPRSSRLRPN